MTRRIDYTFKIDGFFDSVNYYRSETPMNPSSMPAPTDTGITGFTYTDDTIVNQINYYVRFGSVRGVIEKISDEIVVELAPRHLIDMSIENGVIVENGSLGVGWTIHGSASVLTDSVSFPKTPGSYLRANIAFNMSKNYEIELEILRNTASPSSSTLFSNGGTTSGSRAAGGVDFMLSGSIASSAYINKVSTVGAYTIGPFGHAFAFDTYYKVKFVKSGLSISMYVDDVLMQTLSVTSKGNSTANVDLNPLTLGWGSGNTFNGQFVGNMKAFRLISYS